MTFSKERGVVPLASAKVDELHASSLADSFMTSQHAIQGQPLQRDFCFSVRSIDIGNSPLIPDIIPIPNINLDAKERVYVFSASSDQERKEWIRCLTGMVENAGAAMTASAGSLSSLSTLGVNAAAMHRDMMVQVNAVEQHVEQAKQQMQMAAASGQQMGLSNADDLSAAYGLIIKMGPGHCGFVVFETHGSATQSGIRPKRDVIVGMGGTRIQPYPNAPAALMAYGEAKKSAFQSYGTFRLTVCDVLSNNSEREVTLTDADAKLQIGYQENIPGKADDYFVEVWRSMGGGTVVSAGHVRYLEQPSPANQDLLVEAWAVAGGGFSMSAGHVPFFSYHGPPPSKNLVELHRSVGGGMMMNIGEKAPLPTRY
eukprot:TRINITY_DN16654_c0_g1_i1.p1 TRINITY_DN16654_c0_g1~~TRINITY_DN16654_c0_g1_i1.p1  ORF type:complete len:370 (+),score=84.38 TRINITY_DN16654_c0_g1_i1:135-1244(+)